MSNIHTPPSGGQSLPSSSSSSPSSPRRETPSVEPAKPLKPTDRLDLPPQFAIRSDGTFLLSTAEAEALGRDLTGRKVWTAIELTLDDIVLLRERARDVEQEVASKLTARLPKRTRFDS